MNQAVSHGRVGADAVRRMASLSARCPTAPVGPALQLEQRSAQTVGLALVRVTFALHVRRWYIWVECESERFEPGIRPRSQRSNRRQRSPGACMTWHFFNSRCAAEYCAAISSSKRSAPSTSDCPGLSPVTRGARVAAARAVASMHVFGFVWKSY